MASLVYWTEFRSFSRPVNDIANFLASLYGEGYKYNSVNAYRSAILSVHDKVDGVDVGQYPIITSLLKGVYNDRPPLPRCINTWDVQTVLWRALLKLLTYKTVFLFVITRPSRSIDLCSLDIKEYSPTQMECLSCPLVWQSSHDKGSG